jgi:hypothetical protein
LPSGQFDPAFRPMGIASRRITEKQRRVGFARPAVFRGGRGGGGVGLAGVLAAGPEVVGGGDAGDPAGGGPGVHVGVGQGQGGVGGLAGVVGAAQVASWAGVRPGVPGFQARPAGSRRAR